MSEIPIETLIESNKAKKRWFPISVDRYRNAFKLDPSVQNYTALRSNLAYSMQYLEFLEKELDEMHLTTVLYVMLYKTYIITAMSVLEGLFSNVVKSNNWWKMTTQESVGTTISNETRFGEEKYIIRTEILKRVEPTEQAMTLDELIGKLERHRNALKVNHLVYPALKRLRRLRNRVHLQMSESNTDHDYNAFGPKEKREMGEILYTILTSEMVTDNPQVFDFLKVNLDRY